MQSSHRTGDSSVLQYVLSTSLLLLLIPGLLVLTAEADPLTGGVQGQVLDEADGEPLPGATVLIEELDVGAATDSDGTFEITGVEPGTYTLRVTFVGYQPQEQTIEIASGEMTEVIVEMPAGEAQLDELVVTGYEQVQRREETSSISSVTAEDIGDVSLQNPESMLQGRMAGVDVTATSGNPGGAFQVNVRGTGSINAASEPLYIVDGTQISFDALSGQTSQSPLNMLNARDIESIEVLKGAAAASIYGAEAANGVVLIETKRGFDAPTQVTFNMEQGVRNADNPVDFLNTNEYLDFLGEARVFNGLAPDVQTGRQQAAAGLASQYNPGNIAPDEDIALTVPTPDGGEAQLTDTSWPGVIFEDRHAQRYNASVRGGGTATQFFISGRFEDVGGHVSPKSQFQDIGLRANVDHQITDDLELSVTSNISRIDQEGVCQDGNFINCPPSQMMFEPPFTFPRTEDGDVNPFTSFGLTNNPVTIFENVSRDVQTIHLVGNVDLNYRVAPWLNLQGTFAYDRRDTEDVRHDDTIASPGVGGETSILDQTSESFNVSLTGNYNFGIEDVHNFRGVVGTEYRQDYAENFFVQGQGFPGPFFSVLDAAADPVAASGSETEWTRASAFGTVRYNFDERYFLTFTLRADGHSRFGDDERWGFFPSVSGGWSIADEEFFDVDAVDELRLRGSYGIIGNSDIGNFAARGLYSASGSYGGNTGIRPNQLANAQLTWEEAREIEIGLDFAFFAGRVSGEIGVFRRDTQDLLFDDPLPGDSGFSSITRNIGEIRNQGIEFEVTTTNIQTEDFRWDTNFNAYLPENEVLSLPDGETINPTSFTERIEEGEPLGHFFVPEFAGVNPADGRPMYRDQDGELTYTPTEPDDNQIYNDAIPTVRGGFGTTVQYSNLSLDLQFDYNVGQWVFANTQYFFNRTPDFQSNLMANDVKERWQEPGDQTFYPRAMQGGADFEETVDYRTITSSQAPRNASYLRLRDITLSYNVPESLTDGVRGVNNIRIYANALNLLTVTNWPYFDPEASTDTDDIFGNFYQASYPVGRELSLGIEVDI